MDKRKSIAAVNISIILFGTVGLFAKSIFVPAIGITFGRVLFSFVTLLIFSIAAKRSLRIKSRKQVYFFFASGALLAVHWWSFLESIKISTVAVGTVTFSAFPLFVTFLEPVFFRERLKISSVITAALILFGVLITVPQFSLENKMFLGIATGMLSSFCYALLTLFNRYFSREGYSGTTIALYEQGFAAVLLFPCVLMADISASSSDIWLIMLLGVVSTALAHSLFISGLKTLSARMAGVISSLESVYGILLALFFLGEIPSPREIAGAAVIFTVVVISQIKYADE